MANEVLPSSITDLIASESLSAEVLYLLADRDSSILNHPAIMRKTGPVGSTVVRVPHLGLGGYDLLEDHTPGSEVSNTALTDGKTDVTVAPRTKAYAVDDFAKFLVGDKLSPQKLAEDLVIAVGRTMVDLIANITDDFTTTVETTGVNLTWAKVQEAKGLLSVGGATGPIIGLFSKQQWADLEANAISMGNVIRHQSPGIVNAGLELYKGNYFGIDCYVSEFVPTANAGADHAGALFAPGAIAWADVAMDSEGDPNIADFGTARLERARRGERLETKWVFSHYGGASKAIDAAGVTIISDA